LWCNIKTKLKYGVIIHSSVMVQFVPWLYDALW